MDMTTGAAMPCLPLCVSIVSHGHGSEVLALLRLLAHAPDAAAGSLPARVIVTFNLPDPQTAQTLADEHWPFELWLRHNLQPLGFGANHNRAFAQDAQQGAPHRWLMVLNPDLAWPATAASPLAALAQTLSQYEQAALAYPQQTDAQGHPQDHERLWPTPRQLLRRYLRGGAGRREVPPEQPPDWVNAACILLRRSAFDAVGGFDERFYMYCEDVDLCLRLRLAGWQLVHAPGAVVQHGARRASHRPGSHLRWHLQSLWRFWRSTAWRQWRQRQD